MSPPPQEDLTQHELSQPPSPVRNDRQEAPEEDNDGHDGDDADGDLHENNFGMEAYYMQEYMDHDIPYNRCYASESG